MVLAGPEATGRSQLVRIPGLLPRVFPRTGPAHHDITFDRVRGIVTPGPALSPGDLLGAALSGLRSDQIAVRRRTRRPVGRTAPPAPARPARFVNTLIGRPGSSRSLPPDRPLSRDSRYELRVNIGRPAPGSLLPAADGEWPQEHLPAGELRLRAVLRMEGWQEPMVGLLTLPESGESFACGCPEGGPHRQTCQREPWLRFAIRTPKRDRRWRGSLDLYYHAAVVHAQRLVLPVGDRQGGPRAELAYRRRPPSPTWASWPTGPRASWSATAAPGWR